MRHKILRKMTQQRSQGIIILIGIGMTKHSTGSCWLWRRKGVLAQDYAYSSLSYPQAEHLRILSPSFNLS